MQLTFLSAEPPASPFPSRASEPDWLDPRGNLMLTYLAIAARYRPQWLVWENVPGVLSSNRGRDFGTFLRGLAECGYGFAYRVLDAQYVRTGRFPHAVPQRRRRVFVVGYFGDWRPAAAVLFDGQSLRGDPPPRREAGQRPAPCLSTGTRGYGEFELSGGMTTAADVAPTLNAAFGKKLGLENQHIDGGGGYSSVPPVSMCLNAGGMGRSDAETETLLPTTGGVFNVAPTVYSIMPQNSGKDYKARVVEVAQPLMAAGPSSGNQGGDYALQPIAFGHQNSAQQGISASSEITPTLDKSKTPAVVYPINTQIAMRHEALGEGTGLGIGDANDPGYTLQAGHSHAVNVGMAVRRLTPTECERLQGFPNGHTLVPHRGKPAADGPRYKALGNSMAVNVMAWLGERIELVNTQLDQERAA